MAVVAALGLVLGVAPAWAGPDVQTEQDGPVTWVDCPSDLPDDVECGTLDVPIDWGVPRDERRASIFFAVHRATGERKGTYTFNPGGPGTGGVGGLGTWLTGGVYGPSGALPPAIAWAGATNSLTIDPLILVAIIFFWTPPHFWALSLLRSQDYREAGVPMLPVTHGAAHTRLQILLYSSVMVPLGLAPTLTGLGGQIYTAAAGFTGALFLVLAVRVARSRAGDAPDPTGLDLYAATAADQRAARDLFAFSILYLFVVFAALLAEHGLGLHAPVPWLSGWVGAVEGSGA